MAGVFNRLGINDVINWEHIERIKVLSGPEVQLYFVSGEIAKYEAENAIAIIDMISTFPDISIVAIRDDLKAAMRKIQMDIPQEEPTRTPVVRRGTIQTDIPDPNMR